MLAGILLASLAAPGVAVAAPIKLIGANLIVNPGAELGPAALDGSTVETVPGWTTTGSFTVVPYGAPDGFPGAGDPGPSQRGANFFVGGPQSAASSASQVINVASIAPLIDARLVRYTLAGSLGGWTGQGDNAQLVATFLGGGRTVGSAQIGPVSATDRQDATGLLPRADFGSVPAGTRRIVVTLMMTRGSEPLNQYNDGYADNLLLSLGALFGSNLIVNPGAELGVADADWTHVVPSIPGWTTSGSATVGPYDADGFPASADPGPADRGSHLFIGGPDAAFSSITQVVNVAAASRLIGTGLVPFRLSAYLGGWTDQRDDAVVRVRFESPAGSLGESVIGPVTAGDRAGQTGLLLRSTSGLVPAGTTTIVVTIEMTRRENPPATFNDASADDLVLTIGS